MPQVQLKGIPASQGGAGELDAGPGLPRANRPAAVPRARGFRGMPPPSRAPSPPRPHGVPLAKRWGQDGATPSFAGAACRYGGAREISGFWQTRPALPGTALAGAGLPAQPRPPRTSTPAYGVPFQTGRLRGTPAPSFGPASIRADALESAGVFGKLGSACQSVQQGSRAKMASLSELAICPHRDDPHHRPV